jgi:hypothetical protein
MVEYGIAAALRHRLSTGYDGPSGT